MSPKTLSSTILTDRSILLSHLFMDSKRLHAVIIPILPLLRISLLVHSHQIVLQSLIHTINSINSIPLRNGNTRNVSMKIQQWNGKRMDCLMRTQFMNSNEELDKWYRVDSSSLLSRLLHEESTHWIFIISLIPVHLWRFLAITNTIHANQKEWMKRQVSFARMLSE